MSTKNGGPEIPGAATLSAASLRPADDDYEASLSWWSRGWDAAAEYYQPKLERLEHEADRLYVLAYCAPKEVAAIQRNAVDAGLAEFAERFFAEAER